MIGASDEGAGSGGRIAIHLTEYFIFGGVLSALGGTSDGNHHGSPGTVFVNVTVGEELHRTLQIDNYNRGYLPVALAESSTTVYKFERIHLVRQGTLNVKQVTRYSTLFEGRELDVRCYAPFRLLPIIFSKS